MPEDYPSDPEAVKRRAYGCRLAPTRFDGFCIAEVRGMVRVAEHPVRGLGELHRTLTRSPAARRFRSVSQLFFSAAPAISTCTSEERA
jgi:hypothetical protein